LKHPIQTLIGQPAYFQEVYAYNFDADEWTPEGNTKYLDHMNVQGFLDSKKEGYIPNDDYILSTGRGIIRNPNYYARRTTMATQLAINNSQQLPFRFTTKKVSEAINDKQVIRPTTWKHTIPPEYHRYGKVVSEQEAQRFPKTRVVPARLGLEAPALAWPEAVLASSTSRPSQSHWERLGSGLARLQATAFQSHTPRAWALAFRL
jgi:hypothetical protein